MSRKIACTCSIILIIASVAAFAFGCKVQATPAKTDDPIPVAPATPKNTPWPTAAGANGRDEDVDWDTVNAAVIIWVQNQIYDVVPLQDTVVTVEQGDGKTNEVTITERGVHMSHSSCDNQDCVEQGEITLDNYQERILMNFVVCLPNMVSLELVVKEDE